MEGRGRVLYEGILYMKTFGLMYCGALEKEFFYYLWPSLAVETHTKALQKGQSQIRCLIAPNTFLHSTKGTR